MSEQFFTDDKMFVLALAFFLLMLAVGILLLYWRDSDLVWVIALLLIQLIAIVYYYEFWTRLDSPITLFPEANLLVRPYLVSLWALILVYAVVRLRVKLKVLHK